MIFFEITDHSNQKEVCSKGWSYRRFTFTLTEPAGRTTRTRGHDVTRSHDRRTSDEIKSEFKKDQ